MPHIAALVVAVGAVWVLAGSFAAIIAGGVAVGVAVAMSTLKQGGTAQMAAKRVLVVAAIGLCITVAIYAYQIAQTDFSF